MTKNIKGRPAGVPDGRVTAADIAAAIEVSVRQPIKWKAGTSDPSSDSIYNAAAVTGVDLDQVPTTGRAFWEFLQAHLPASENKNHKKGRKKKQP